jgi:phosphopantothenoylcysteine decarboxylase/phosphopantothenate--cysteine ligase
MQALGNKKILLGITGGIAAYKSAELVRLLTRAGAEVRVVMTPSAQEFVQPLTYQALSGHRVYIDLFDAEADSAMDHIELARWCDLLLVAPASADFLGKMNAGYADNLLLTLCLASKRPVAVAPAMNQQMFANPATQDNLKQLGARNVLIWGPAEGDEPEQLLANVVLQFVPGKLDGVELLLTAGPTREAIDPVRYISNRSSGKMGYALAEAALQAGAEAVMQQVSQSDIFIGCAAVSDYRVDQVATHKIKKSENSMSLPLVLNVDILAAVSALDNRPFCVGFAAETQNLEKYALAKLEQKNLDMIAANPVGDGDSGFETDINQLEVFWRDGRSSIERGGKLAIAKQLIDLIAERYTCARS